MDIFSRTIRSHFDRLLAGLAVTLEVSVIAFVVALSLGLALCFTRMYVKPLRWLAIIAIEFGRNTPIYVQLMWVNYVWPDLFGWPTSTFTAGWAALAVQSSGYLAETFRAGIEGVRRGQWEAAYSLGMSPTLTMRRIVLRQVVVTMSPSIMNQFLVVLKSSTLVSVIAVPDLMYEALRLTSIWFEPIEILSVTAFLYIAVVFVLSNLIQRYTARLQTRYT